MKTTLRKLSGTEPAAADPADVAAVWLSPASAARLVDMSTAALRKRLAATQLPAGILRRWGRRILIHKARFLNWLEAGEPPV